MAHSTPLDNNLFTFNHVLLAEVSNHSRHPRAPVPELRAILHPTDAADRELDDHVGHWWEAQLLHYGLRPSKTKAVAKTRLLDALNHETLAVPRDIVKMEAELKKQWTKNERVERPKSKEAHLRTSMVAGRTTKTTTTTSIHLLAVTQGIKRETLQYEVAAASRPTKRSKAAERQSEAPKSQAISTKATSIKSETRKSAPTNSGTTKETANHPRPKQTANRIGDSQPLGLLNGRYEIECPELEDWGYSSSDFSLILTLEGESLWGAYDFGMFEGILRIPRRPYTVNDERFEFTWRGRENSEGQTSFGNGNIGWLEFLGGGKIRGMIACYGQAMFEGQRVSGNVTRIERDARSMRNEWDDYNQDEYERANRARWGRSGW